MKKILSSWSGMRKYLENEMLAESLKGRIRYGCTSYIGMDGCRIFDISVDGEQVKRFSWETLNKYFIDNGYKTDPDPHGVHEFWNEFWELTEKIPVSERTEYTDNEFCLALKTYRRQDIMTSINSDDPIVKMFAVTDRRLGKRTLLKLKDTVEDRPTWLQGFYNLRFKAEKII